MPATALDSLSPGSRLVDRVKARLRTAILEGRLVPGEALSVPELARHLGVSRSPVREALVHLLAEGLAIETTRRGISVAARDDSQVAELRELSALFDVAAASRLARHGADEPLLERLERSCAAQRDAIRRGDDALWARLNQEFHRLLIARCGNGTLAAQCSLVVNQLRTAGVDPRSAEQPAPATAQHEKLVAALRARDLAAAETAAKLHAGPPA